MPPVMIRMIPMMLFSWYALFIYWQYITLSLAGSLYTAQAPFTEGFRNAELLTGQIGAFYNFIAFISAFILAGLAGRFTPEWLHLICLLLAGAGLWLLPQMEEIWQIYACITGLGLCWASIMGNPYIILARNIPRHRTAIYMGIFNMFIVIPMLLETFTMPLYYHQWLGGKAQYAIQLAGVLLILAAISVFLIPAGSRKTPVKSQSDL